MIDMFDEEEGRLLRRLFAYSVEDPLSVRLADMSILGFDPPEYVATMAAPESEMMNLLSQISLSQQEGGAPPDLVDRLSAVMLVGYRRGFFVAAGRAGLPTSEDAMAIVDLYPGLQEACSHYSLLQASTMAMEEHARLKPLSGRKEMVHQSLGLFQRALSSSFRQGYRTGALTAEALRDGVRGDLATSLPLKEATPDDQDQNRAVAGWLGSFGWDGLQREILRHQTAGFWSRLEKVTNNPVVAGLPRAVEGWMEAEDGLMEDLLVAIAQAGLRTGLRLQMQLASGRYSLPSDWESRLTYRVSRSVGLLARQWRAWHPAPSSVLRVRQTGEYLTAPTFASGAALGHMMAQALDTQTGQESRL